MPLTHISKRWGALPTGHLLRGVRKSAVAMTADMDTFAPYYTINWSEEGGTALSHIS